MPNRYLHTEEKIIFRKGDHETQDNRSDRHIALQLLSFPALQAKAWSGEEPLTKIESDLEVTHEGTGTGRIGITGDPVKEYEGASMIRKLFDKH